MDWDHLEANWKNFAATVKAKWDKLSEDEIADLKGKREHLEAKIRELYGHAKEEAAKDIDEWVASLKRRSDEWGISRRIGLNMPQTPRRNGIN